MKHRIWIRRKDEVKQRYWVGKKLRNYGSQIIRQRIRKDLPILPEEQFQIKKDIIRHHPTKYPIGKIFPQTHRKEELVRVFEKNPELYREFRKYKPVIFFHTGDTTKSIPASRIITISNKNTVGDYIYDFDEGIYKTEGVESKLRHELRHITDRAANPKEYDKAPKSLVESSSKSAEHISLRKHKTPQRMIDLSTRRFFEDVF